MLVSLRVRVHWVSYAGDESALLADAQAETVLEPRAGYTRTLRFVKADYAAEGRRAGGYVRASVVAVDEGSVVVFRGEEGAGEVAVDAGVAVAADTGVMRAPRLQLAPSKAEVRTDAGAEAAFAEEKSGCVSVRVTLVNPLSVALTEARLRVWGSAAGLEEEEAELGRVEALATVSREVEWCVGGRGAVPGRQTVWAVVETRELDPVHGEADIWVDREENEEFENSGFRTMVWDGDREEYTMVEE